MGLWGGTRGMSMNKLWFRGEGGGGEREGWEKAQRWGTGQPGGLGDNQLQVVCVIVAQGPPAS